MNDIKGLLEHASDRDDNAKEDTNNSSSEPLSKSARVRLYLQQRPGVRNKEIVKALAHHGVKSADVANVKSALKRKASKKKSSPSASNTVTPKGKLNEVPPSPGQSLAADEAAPDAVVSLEVLEHGLEFIRQAGGINEAQHILNLIRRIRSM